MKTTVEEKGEPNVWWVCVWMVKAAKAYSCATPQIPLGHITFYTSKIQQIKVTERPRFATGRTNVIKAFSIFPNKSCKYFKLFMRSHAQVHWSSYLTHMKYDLLLCFDSNSANFLEEGVIWRLTCRLSSKCHDHRPPFQITLIWGRSPRWRNERRKTEITGKCPNCLGHI